MNEPIAKRYFHIADRLNYATFQVQNECMQIRNAPDLVQHYERYGNVKDAVPRMKPQARGLLEYILEKGEPILQMNPGDILDQVRQRSRDPAKTA